MEFVEFSRKITPMKMIWRGDSIGELKHGEVFGEITKGVNEYSVNKKKPVIFRIDTPWNWGYNHPSYSPTSFHKVRPSTTKLSEARECVKGELYLAGMWNAAVRDLRDAANGKDVDVSWICFRRITTRYRPLSQKKTPEECAWWLIEGCSFLTFDVPEDIQLLAVKYRKIGLDATRLMSEKTQRLNQMLWQL